MHLAHLAIFPDVYISVLLDLTDECQKRDSKLTELYENDRDWCESQSISDRARKRLFTSRTLRPLA
ncbi:unnamed protein product, partial [Symbiodinium sp. CCMP2456]